MRRVIAVSLLLTCAAPAGAAPPSSCAAKFIGDWRHSGSGNRGTVTPDGRALCSEHPACTQGTWTCSGNVFTYTNSLGTWNYTLEPDGKSMSTNGGAAVAVRLGPVPASARSKDLGSAAKNVTADVLGIDRTPSAAEAPPPAAPKPSMKQVNSRAGEGNALFNTGNDFFNTAMQTSYGNRKAYLRSAEFYFKRSAEEFQKAGDQTGEQRARAKIEEVRALNANTPAKAAEPKVTRNGGQLTKESCNDLDANFIVELAKRDYRDPERARYSQAHKSLKKLCGGL
ncbi:hypothetical protein JJB98_08110 [Bradyrhizobium diazoefficiens]|nr:hypothetical protein [Bradyrhizobium diazoefficiens]QQO19872.1 hypothetical protein JJB98_08110 [Bradyrhizobium diazoefficiens]